MAQRQAICSLGWAHKGSLWVYKIGDASARILTLSDANFLSIKGGRKDFFSVVHNWEGNKIEISAHHHLQPDRSVSSISIQRGAFGSDKTETVVRGDNSVWQELPGAYVAFAFNDFHLFLVNRNGDTSIQTLNWYASSMYDKMYQGIVGVEELPNSHLLIISIPRNSNPVLYDPETGSEVRKLNLAGRLGNPRFCLRASAGELWADDYDHIVKLDARTLNVVATKQLQEDTQGVQRFIGEFSLFRDEGLCLVARPFNGDVIGLDCDSMLQTHRAPLGKQPLLVGLLGEDTVVALDWKTGEFLQGKLQAA